MLARFDVFQQFAAGVTLTGGDTAALVVGGSYGGVAGNINTQKSAGKWYWESIYQNSASPTEDWGTGIVEVGNLPATYVGDGVNSYGLYENGNHWNNAAFVVSGFGTLSQNDVVQHFLDLDNTTYEIAVNGGVRFTVTTTLNAVTYAPAFTGRNGRVFQGSFRQHLQFYDIPAGFETFEVPSALFAIDADQFTTTASISGDPDWLASSPMSADPETFLPSGPVGERWFNTTPTAANLRTDPYTVVTPAGLSNARELETHFAFLFADNHEDGRFLLLNTVQDNVFGTVNLLLETTGTETDPYNIRLQVLQNTTAATIVDVVVASNIAVGELVHLVVRARSAELSGNASDPTGAVEVYTNGQLSYQSTSIVWSTVSTDQRGYFNDNGSRVLYSGTNTTALAPVDGRAYIKNPITFDEWTSPNGIIPPFFRVTSTGSVEQVPLTYYLATSIPGEIVEGDIATSMSDTSADLEVVEGEVSTSIRPISTNVEVVNGEMSTSTLPIASDVQVAAGGTAVGFQPNDRVVQIAEGLIGMGIEVDAVFYLQAPPAATKHLGSPALGLL